MTRSMSFPRFKNFSTGSIVVKAHVLLILDLDELGGSGVRDFGPA